MFHNDFIFVVRIDFTYIENGTITSNKHINGK